MTTVRHSSYPRDNQQHAPRTARMMPPRRSSRPADPGRSSADSGASSRTISPGRAVRRPGRRPRAASTPDDVAAGRRLARGLRRRPGAALPYATRADGRAALPRPARRAPGRGHRPDPVGDGQGPVPRLAGDPAGRHIARHYARHGADYLSDHKVRGAMPVLTKVREVRVPKGVVGIISPWNYPLYLGVGDAIPALLAGNAVVGKADPQTAADPALDPRPDGRGRPARRRCGRSSPARAVVGTALIDHVDYVCFTGSTATGRLVGAQAGERLIGASPRARRQEPADRARGRRPRQGGRGHISAAFANTGQMCIHIERVLVHAAVYDAFRAALVAGAAALSLGQTYDFTSTSARSPPPPSSTRGGPRRRRRRQGATVLAGGRPAPTSARSSTSRPCSRASPPTWSLPRGDLRPGRLALPVAADDEAVARPTRAATASRRAS